MIEDINLPKQTAETQAWLDGMRRQNVVRFELRCDRPNTAPLKDWLVPANIDQPLDTKALAEECIALAEQDGRFMAGKFCFYELRAFRAQTEAACGQRRIVVQAAGDRNTPQADERAAADGQAVISVLSRTVLEMHKLLSAREDSRSERDQKFIDRLLHERDDQEQKRFHVVRLAEDLLSRNAEREQMQRDERRKDDGFRLVAGQLKQLVPIAINRIAGGGPGTGRVYTGEQIVMRLLQSLTPEQLSSFMGQESGLNPEQQMLFGELYMAYSRMNEEKARQGSARETPLNTEAPPGGTNGTGTH